MGHFRNLRMIPVSSLAGRQRFKAVVTKAVSDSSDSSSGSIVKSVQSIWNSPEDRIALAGLRFAAIAAFWASANLIAAIDELPVIPSTLEFIGVLFSWWFTYRYLLFKLGKSWWQRLRFLSQIQLASKLPLNKLGTKRTSRGR